MADIEHKRGQLLSNFPKKHTNQQINEKSFINSTVLIIVSVASRLYTKVEKKDKGLVNERYELIEKNSW